MSSHARESTNAGVALKRLAPTGLRAVVKPAIRRVGQATASLRPPPDFLIIGTKRGGTASLWNWMLQHPSVLPIMPSIQNIKSPHYFYWHYDKGMGWYRGFFPLAATRRAALKRQGVNPVSGEASPYYMFDPRVPGRVAQSLPEVRIVVLLRDPVERAYSHYRERVHAGVEPLSFRDALAAEDDRVAGELERMAREPFYYSRPHDWYAYRSRGLYAHQLRAWQEVIDPDRLLIVRSEDLFDDPQSHYNKVMSFLGLPPHTLEGPARYNYHPAPEVPADVRESLVNFYAPFNDELYTMLDRDMRWSRPGA